MTARSPHACFAPRLVDLENRLAPAAFGVTQLDALRADPAFAGTDGSRVGVAVLDTGTFGAHPDLAGNLVAAYDAVRRTELAPAAARDPVGHGSHVAGIVGSTNPAIGVAPAADLVGVRVLLAEGEERPGFDAVADGLQWVIDNQARFNIRVANLSLGFLPTSNVNDPAAVPVSVRAAGLIDRLEALGVTVVSSAGNSYADFRAPGATLPAAVSTVSVAATWEDDGFGDGFPIQYLSGAVELDARADTLAAFSQRSTLPNQVAAPGQTIFSTWNGDNGDLFNTISGTSMAAPFVSGVVALMQDAAFTAAGRYLEPAAVVRILRDSADLIVDADNPNNGRIDGNGDLVGLPETGLTFRRVNAYRAVQQARAEVTGGGGPTAGDLDATTATAVPLPAFDGNRFTAVAGTVGRDGASVAGANDVDLYRVDLLSPGKLSVAVDAAGGGLDFDAYLRVFDAAGAQLDFSDDANGLFPELDLVLQPGTYFLGVSSFDNSAYDAVTGAGRSGGQSSGDYALRVNLANPDPNGVFTGAVPFAGVPRAEPGTIDSDPPPAGGAERVQVGPADVDFFEVVAPDAGVLAVDVSSARLAGNQFVFDTYVRVFDEAGVEVAENDDHTDPATGQPTTDSRVQVTLAKGQRVFVAVSTFANGNFDPADPFNRSAAGAGGNYELSTSFNNGDRNGTIPAAVTEPEPAVGSAVNGVVGTDFDQPVGADGSLDVDFFRFTPAADGLLDLRAVSPDGSLAPALGLWTYDPAAGDVVLLADTSGREPAVIAPVAGGQTYYVSVTGEGNGGFLWFAPATGTGGHTGRYTLTSRLRPPADLTTLADNSVLANTGTRDLPLGVALGGEVGRDGALVLGGTDVDVYRHVAGFTGRLVVEAAAFASKLGDASDPFLRVFDAAGTEVAFNDDSTDSTLSSRLVLTVTAGQVYYLGVGGAGASARAYDVLTGQGAGAGVRGEYALIARRDTPPLAAADAFAAVAGSALQQPAPGVLLNDRDPENGPLGVELVSGVDPAAGTLELFADGSFTFTPAAGYRGPASFEYRVTDGSFASAPARVALEVQPPPNQPPAAADDAFTFAPGLTQVVGEPGVLANDTDPEGDPVEVLIVSDVDPAAGTLTLFGDGTFEFTPAPGFVGTTSFVYRLNDGTSDGNDATVTITVEVPDARKLVTASGALGLANFYRFDDAGDFQAVTSFAPFDGFFGAVRTAVGDFDGDGVADTVYVTGPGGGALVRITSGATGDDLIELTDVFPGEDLTDIGLFVAAGDIDGDGVDDLVIAPDQGGGPRVKLLSVVNGELVQFQDFFAIDDPDFRGGARVALGDLTGDGRADLAVSAGFRGGPRIALWDGATLEADPVKLVGDFFAFEPELRNGCFVAIGDMDGDGLGELVFGAGPGGGPRVLVARYAELAADVDAALADPYANLFAFDPSQRGGVRVAVKDADGDGLLDLVAGNGEGGAPLMRSFVSTGAGLAESATERVFSQELVEEGIFVG